MAKLILTGSHEAINLKALHGEDVQKLDEVISGINQRNGGFAELAIDLIQGLFIRLHVNESYLFRSKAKQRKAEEKEE